MGKVNNVMRHYVSNKRRFADLFNGVFFHGKKVIRADELTEASEQYTELPTENAETLETGERLERIRDIKMSLKSGECLRILAVENQNLVDYSMPFRCMEYDSMEYRKQIEALKKENREKSVLRTMAEKILWYEVQRQTETGIYAVFVPWNREMGWTALFKGYDGVWRRQ